MTQQVQELINKIKSEGVQAADEKAKEIESQAKKNAEQIVTDAKKQADQLILQANEEAKKVKELTHMALQQAARDTLLSVKKQIKEILHKIVVTDVGDALTTETLSQIVETIVSKFVDDKSAEQNIHVTLSAHDLKVLRDGFVTKLQKHLKQPVRLQSAQDVGKGFTISFDGGKSSFDFTDESLAAFMSAYVNAEVAALLSKAAS